MAGALLLPQGQVVSGEGTRDSLILIVGHGNVTSPVPVLDPLQTMCFRNKYLLLNNQELNELSAISLKANIPEVEAVLNTDRWVAAAVAEHVPWGGARPQTRARSCGTGGFSLMGGCSVPGASLPFLPGAPSNPRRGLPASLPLHRAGSRDSERSRAKVTCALPAPLSFTSADTLLSCPLSSPIN